MIDEEKSTRRPWAWDLTALGVILLTGILCTLFLSPSDPFVFDDNAFFLSRLSHVLHQPGFSVSDWHPEFNGGYPDLLFYPPGTVLIGLFLNTLSLGTLSVFATYYLIAVLSFILPGLTAYFLARVIGLHPLAGLTGALFVLLKPFGTCGLQTFYFGMHSARLSYALMFFGLAVGIYRVRQQKVFLGALEVGLITAAGLLCHVYSALFPLIGFALTLILRSRTIGKSTLLKAVILAGGCAFFLDAFWLVPGLSYSGRMLPFQWSENDPLALLDAVFTNKWILVFLVLTGLSAIKAQRREDSLDDLGRPLVLILPLAAAAFVAVNRLLLVEILDIQFLDSLRLMEVLTGLTALFAGQGLWVFARLLMEDADERIRPAKRTLIVGIVLTLTVLLPLLKAPIMNQVRPNTIMNAQHLSFIRGKTTIDDLWGHLASKRGAVLCTSPYVNLIDPATGQGYGHNHILCFTPLFTGRPILNATPTVPNPLSAYLLDGENHKQTVEELVEGASPRLFGIPWDAMTLDQLIDNCLKLGVTDVVVQPREEEAMQFFASLKTNPILDLGYFQIYTVANETPELYRSSGCQSVTVQTLSSERIAVSVANATAGATIDLTTAYFPLWTASHPGVAVRESNWHTIELHLPAGGPYRFDVVYRKGRLEKNTALISTAAMILWLAGWMILSLGWKRKTQEDATAL